MLIKNINVTDFPHLASLDRNKSESDGMIGYFYNFATVLKSSIKGVKPVKYQKPVKVEHALSNDFELLTSTAFFSIYWRLDCLQIILCWNDRNSFVFTGQILKLIFIQVVFHIF